MKVWCIMEHDPEGSYLLSVWSTEQKAKDKLASMGLQNRDLSIEDWEVDE